MSRAVAAEMLPAPAMWLGAGAGAVVLHLLALQMGLTQFAPPPAPPERTLPDIEILAMPLSVAGREAPERLGAADGAETAQTADDAERVSANDAESLEASASNDRLAANDAETATAAGAQDRLTATAADAVQSATPQDRVAASPAQSAERVVGTAPTPPRNTAANTAPAAALPAPVQAARVQSTAPRVVASTPPVASAPRQTLPARSGDVAPPRVVAAPAQGQTVQRLTAAPAAPVTAPVDTAPPAPGTAPAAAAPQRVGAVAPVSTATPRIGAVGVAPPAAAPRVAAAPPAAAPSAPATAAAAPPAGQASLSPIEGVERAGIAAPPETRLQAATRTYETVLEMLARYSGGPCFAALPSLGEGDAFQLETFARSTSDLEGFRAALEVRTGQLPNTRMKPVSAAQCQALTYVQNSPAYPSFELFFQLDAHQIASGSRLSGRIGNTTGGFLSFLLIDDEGLVQDLGSFLKFTPGAAVFSVPMTLSGGPVETQQLLMALSTPAQPDTVRQANGTPAEDFFARLAAELGSKGVREDLAVVAFSVR